MPAHLGVRHHSAKLDENKVREIRNLYANTQEAWTQKQLAEKFSINQKTVCEIVNRRIWRHVK